MFEISPSGSDTPGEGTHNAICQEYERTVEVQESTSEGAADKTDSVTKLFTSEAEERS